MISFPKISTLHGAFSNIPEDQSYVNIIMFVTWIFLFIVSLVQLVLEGVRARQKQDSLLMEKRVIEQDMQQANTSLNLYDIKASRIEDQVAGS